MSDASRIQPAYTGGRLDIGGETSPRKQQDHLTDYNRVKQEQAAQRALEQKRDLQLLQTYDPWGKPGAGAPGVSFCDISRRLSRFSLEWKSATR
eukprot:m.506762 g.506762  ORF g.506762 m.506762 type:complete len:94 (-) comp57373_c0_seq8:1790-2071(-)